MKHPLGLAIAAGMLTGCAAFETKDDSHAQYPQPEIAHVEPLYSAEAETTDVTTQSYIGVKGFLARPPTFADPMAQNLYERCSPLKITAIHEDGGKILVTVKQSHHTFVITGINRKNFEKSADGRILLLDRFWVKNLNVVGSGRELSSTNPKICFDDVWPGMTTAMFRFKAGDPEFRRSYKTPKGQFDVWTFMGKDKSKPKHYYFTGDRLYSWTR